jgi:hypothetical protein
MYSLSTGRGPPGISALALIGKREGSSGRGSGSPSTSSVTPEECARPVFRVSTETTADFRSEFNVAGA